MSWVFVSWGVVSWDVVSWDVVSWDVVSWFVCLGTVCVLGRQLSIIHHLPVNGLLLCFMNAIVCRFREQHMVGGHQLNPPHPVVMTSSHLLFSNRMVSTSNMSYSSFGFVSYHLSSLYRVHSSVSPPSPLFDLYRAHSAVRKVWKAHCVCEFVGICSWVIFFSP